MSVNRNSAEKLLNASEMELFNASRRDALNALGKTRVLGKIERVRRLRDKYRDLFRRQRLATRGRTGSKHGSLGEANLRTQRKSALMSELLTRFEHRLVQIRDAEKRTLQAATARRMRRTVTKRSRTAAPAVTGRRKARDGFISPQASATAQERKLHQSGGVAARARLRSQGRRNQAKRDRRR